MAFRTVNIIFRFGTPKLSSFNSVVTRTFASAAPNPSYQNVIVERKGEKQNVGLITLNRPKSLNALCRALVDELIDAVSMLDKDDSIGAIVITGSEKAFAAGADIKEMMTNTYSSNHKTSFLENWQTLSRSKKPVIAAVNGYALGGGCEVAMLCDIIYAGDNAKFGQPEITIGTIPGGGGTQRIARSCGKSKAMEICLTGDHFSAQEAEKMGLVSKVFPANQTVAEAIKLGEKIARHSPLLVRLCKEAVNVAFETSLQEGLRFEKSYFFGTFATADQKEGMGAFAEKRKPNFKNE